MRNTTIYILFNVLFTNAFKKYTKGSKIEYITFKGRVKLLIMEVQHGLY